MFWKRSGEQKKLPRPSDLMANIGSHLVCEEKMNPEKVWNTLKQVSRPLGDKDQIHCRIFDVAVAERSGVKIEDWTSLDGHQDLIVFECYFDKLSHQVRPGKFVEPAQPPAITP